MLTNSYYYAEGEVKLFFTPEEQLLISREYCDYQCRRNAFWQSRGWHGALYNARDPDNEEQKRKHLHLEEQGLGDDVDDAAAAAAASYGCGYNQVCYEQRP